MPSQYVSSIAYIHETLSCNGGLGLVSIRRRFQLPGFRPPLRSRAGGGAISHHYCRDSLSNDYRPGFITGPGCRRRRRKPQVFLLFTWREPGSAPSDKEEELPKEGDRRFWTCWCGMHQPPPKQKPSQQTEEDTYRTRARSLLSSSLSSSET